jgi:FAD/FMN-containing dehydrogenase
VFEKDTNFLEHLEGIVSDGVLKRGGSISAEHGSGQYKHKYMTQIKDPATLASMRSVKQLFDPNGIMNPGKYIPPIDYTKQTL